MARNDGAIVVVGVAALGLAVYELVRPPRTVAITPEQSAAEVAASAASNQAPRALLSPSPAAAGPVGNQGATVAHTADLRAAYSAHYGREVDKPIDFAAGAEVKVAGGVARFVRYTPGTRSALWTVNGRDGLIPWDTPPQMYDWRSGTPKPQDAKRSAPVALFDSESLNYFGPGTSLSGALSTVAGWIRALVPEKAAPPGASSGGGSW